MEEKTLGENIVKYRDMSGMTQVQLAERVGVSAAFISRVERGQGHRDGSFAPKR